MLTRKREMTRTDPVPKTGSQMWFRVVCPPIMGTGSKPRNRSCENSGGAFRMRLVQGTLERSGPDTWFVQETGDPVYGNQSIEVLVNGVWIRGRFTFTSRGWHIEAADGNTLIVAQPGLKVRFKRSDSAALSDWVECP